MKFLNQSKFSRERYGLHAWIGCLCVAASALAAGLVTAGYRLEHPLLLAILAGLAVAAASESIQVTSTTEASIASLLGVFAAVMLGPLSGGVVAAVGLIAALPRKDVSQPVLRWANWTSTRFIATAVAGLAAAPIVRGGHAGFLALFAAVAAAFLAETAVDLALDPIAPHIRGSATYGAIVRANVPTVLASVPFHTTVVAILAFSYRAVSPWSVALFAVPAFAAQRLLILYRQQRETAEALTDANERLAKANLSFATALVATLDARDQYTAGHSAAVAIYARDIAKRMGLSEREQELAHVSGLVHDVGKIGLPAGLLEKPGALTLDERRQMERHSEIGERILRNVADYAEIAEIVRHHHERVDGNGYPDNLVGDEIPPLARIIAVADAYNAMTSDRPYRDAMPSRVARLRLAQAVESQFDTSVVAAFEAILAGATESYRVGVSPEFGIVHADFRVQDETENEPLDTALHAIASGVAVAAV